jgi:hypothetical protein
MEEVKSLTVDKEVAKLRLLARFIFNQEDQDLDLEKDEMHGLGVMLHEIARSLEEWNRENPERENRKIELVSLDNP